MGKFVVIVPSHALVEDFDKICPYCSYSIYIRNPSGHCDHLYYPDNCEGRKEEMKVKEQEHGKDGAS